MENTGAVLNQELDYNHEAKRALAQATQAHKQWKTIFENSLKQQIPIDVDRVRRDDCCGLGKWLHTNGQRYYGALPEFTLLIEKHRSFHEVAGIVANVINSRQLPNSDGMLGAGSQFAVASTEVILGIYALQRVIGR